MRFLGKQAKGQNLYSAAGQLVLSCLFLPSSAAGPRVLEPLPPLGHGLDVGALQQRRAVLQRRVRCQTGPGMVSLRAGYGVRQGRVWYQAAPGMGCHAGPGTLVLACDLEYISHWSPLCGAPRIDCEPYACPAPRMCA